MAAQREENVVDEAATTGEFGSTPLTPYDGIGTRNPASANVSRMRRLVSKNNQRASVNLIDWPICRKAS